MAGANNRALAKAGMSKANIETYRAMPMTPARGKMSAHSITMAHSPEKQAAVKGFQGAAAARLRQAGEERTARLGAAKEAAKERQGGLRDLAATMMARRKPKLAVATRGDVEASLRKAGFDHEGGGNWIHRDGRMARLDYRKIADGPADGKTARAKLRPDGKVELHTYTDIARSLASAKPGPDKRVDITPRFVGGMSRRS